MKSISTEGGVGDGLLLLGDEGEVVIVNATGYWSFYSIVQTILIYYLLFLIGFSTDFLHVIILALDRGISSFSCHAKAKLPSKH